MSILPAARRAEYQESVSTVQDSEQLCVGHRSWWNFGALEHGGRDRGRLAADWAVIGVEWLALAKTDSIILFTLKPESTTPVRPLELES
jgi:hypothetical protein